MDTSNTPVCAAEYVRMSTDDQKYSPENQSAKNHAYAAAHGMKIVRTYSDHGKSGLTFDRRDALRQLIEDVLANRADYNAILVYDVSRWGRFQDPDESGYYEYICKRAGIPVHYCAEQFQNDTTPYAAALKALKRASAADYSRDLSVKVFAGKSRLISLGYTQGGPPGYALRRLLVDPHGRVKGILAPGEHKSIKTDRVILTPGPPHEVAILRWMFTSLVRGKNVKEIVDSLNRRGVPTATGGPWNGAGLRRILTSERYIGNLVWNQHSFKLQNKFVRNDPKMWLRAENALAAIIEPRLFEAAQLALPNRHAPRGVPRRYSDERLLNALRRLLRKRGRLTSHLLNKEGLQSAPTYTARFGSLKRAFHLVGFDLDKYRKRTGYRLPGPMNLSNEQMLAGLRELLKKQNCLSTTIINKTKKLPSANAYRGRFGSLIDAYRLVGFVPRARLRPRDLSDPEMLSLLTTLWNNHGHLSPTVINKSADLPSATVYHRRFGGLREAYKLIGYRGKRVAETQGQT